MLTLTHTHTHTKKVYTNWLKLVFADGGVWRQNRMKRINIITAASTGDHSVTISNTLKGDAALYDTFFVCANESVETKKDGLAT